MGWFLIKRKGERERRLVFYLGFYLYIVSGIGVSRRSVYFKDDCRGLEMEGEEELS